MPLPTSMNTFLTKTLIFSSSLAALFLSSCAQYSAENPPIPNPAQTKIPKAVFVNPFPAGTHEHFQADPGYRKTYKLWKHESLFASTPRTLTRIEISLPNQRGVMYRGDQVIFDWPVSSGKRAFPTRPGKFKVLELIEDEKRSNLYGKIYDAEGTVVTSDADSTVDEIPEGGRFEGALMRYWMRITWSGIGMHKGRVPRYAASHGCIRTYSTAVSDVFSKVQIGTPVTVSE